MREAGSLRGRLLRRLALLLALLLIVSGWTSYLNGRAAADRAYDRSLLAFARAVSERMETKDGALQVNVPYLALDAFAYDSAGRIFYQVLDFDGRLISGYEGLPAPPDTAARTQDYPALARFYSADYQGLGVRVVSLLQPISEPGLKGMAEIRVAETDGQREALARSLLNDTLWRMTALAIGALLLVWLAVSVALRPLAQLSVAVTERQPDDLRPLPNIAVQRELSPLVNALNGFTGRLRNQFERQAQFIADAAHELRTPLAALKARIELGLREQNPAIWRETLEASAQDTDRLTQLANQLLSLARIENGAQSIAQGGAQRLDLAQVARDLALAMAALAYKRGVTLALEAEHPVRVIGEPTLLNELLSNLLDNALAHTPVGGSVILRVAEGGVLEVEDDGPGIPEHDRKKVFDRFYRRQANGKGAGLGLSIVGEICRIHRAEITLGEGSLGGLIVRVTFPVID
ncbi:sensor histidine kinase [Pseudomonas matsuisoli]|uniref:histidine kinase n=1 Tax=Pseudomonas matsuisoli TaxID=1515666 RepID=A0A917PL05_9PSED|nr:sensor histidine kinase [Pseudomonas matsuisoli]GGJ82323.1 two-component sensor [Pseudomonas matsuisoli]